MNIQFQNPNSRSIYDLVGESEISVEPIAGEIFDYDDSPLVNMVMGLDSFELCVDPEVNTALLNSSSATRDNPATDPVSVEDLVSTEIDESVLVESITVGNPEGVQFTLNYAAGTPQEVIDGVARAAEIWSSKLSDRVNLTIDLTYNPDEPRVLANTVANQYPITYEKARQALIEDATSDEDRLAIANLTDYDLNILMNNTSENNGSDTPYLDDNGGLNNSFVLLNSANAKSLGISIEELAEAQGVTPETLARLQSTVLDSYPVDLEAADATINFNSDVNWDFDSSNGIDLDAVGFEATAVHELGHALGFLSSADLLDTAADPNLDLLNLIATILPDDITDLVDLLEIPGVDDAVLFVDAIAVDRFVSENQYLPQTLDLFRYSPESFALGAIDFTAGNIDGKYFSIDGGVTEIAPLSTGTTTGDFNQLSHWQDGDSIGIMGPGIFPGEVSEITDTDLLAFDVIGWDLA